MVLIKIAKVMINKSDEKIPNKNYCFCEMCCLAQVRWTALVNADVTFKLYFSR